MVERLTCDSKVAGSNLTHDHCVPTPSQRTIPPGRLTSTSETWGVNGHTTRCISPVHVVAPLGLMKRRSAPQVNGPLRLGERHLLYLYIDKDKAKQWMK